MRTANDIAKEIRAMDTWDMELLKELCEAAECWMNGMPQAVKLLKALLIGQLKSSM